MHCCQGSLLAIAWTSGSVAAEFETGVVRHELSVFGCVRKPYLTGRKKLFSTMNLDLESTIAEDVDDLWCQTHPVCEAFHLGWNRRIVRWALLSSVEEAGLVNLGA